MQPPGHVPRRLGLSPLALFALLLATVLANVQHQPPPSNHITNQKHSQPVGGPNVCRSRYRSYCCSGWQLKPTTGLCIIPICSNKCGRGRCVKPNLCVCEGGKLAPSCTDRRPPSSTAYMTAGEPSEDHRRPSERERTETTCRYPCLNGGSCSNGRCVCKPGYQGETCGQALCVEPCLNGGRCVAPDRCACVYGFTGRRCEADYRTGPCFTRVADGMCQGQLPGVVCTRNLCCATVGKAWGHPCEKCPSRLPCDEGYLKNIHSGDCVDINECEAIPGLCLGGKCVNTIGSFTCNCPPGRARDPESNACRDMDECRQAEEEGLCENGRCVNTEGSYYCICDRGFIPNRDSTSCIDARQGYCYTMVTRGGVCINSLPMRLSKRDCCCGMNMGKAWGENCDSCPTPREESYKGLCGDISGGGPMHPVDECGLRKDICGGGQCVDTADGYTCHCHPGYEKNQSQVCEDVNECTQGTYCFGGSCVNLPGSFSCTCPPGFDLSSDGRRCSDHDECSQNGMCANGRCINMDGSFKCRCNPGFILSPTGHSCIDVDECYENPRICLNGRCENVPGSYRCKCLTGFTLSSDGAFCIDTDECVETGMCANGKCVNMEGTFKCVCDSGFKLSYDRAQCIDIDECHGSKPPCQNGACHNTVGSFYCSCPVGFNLSPDGRTCIDSKKDLCYSEWREGQCLMPSSRPVAKSVCCCVGFPGQRAGWGTPCQPCPMHGTFEYNILCPHGPGMNHNGDDINECATNPNLCQNGACENLMGSHRCVCNPGYEVDSTGKICIDIDECKVDELICNGGQCRNTPGSFQCICPTGTELNVISHVCEDFDECRELGADACFNGRCINTIGSYECDCPPGSVLDHTGRVCIDNRKGTCWTRLVAGRCENNLPQVTLRSECCCSVGVAWGSPCDLCHHKDCECSKGYAKVDGKACTDINECELNAGICRGGGTCVNTEGSFTCVCPPGLSLDSTGSLCIDARQESCFTEWKHGLGVGVLEGLYPKTLCCCSTVGRAWGGPSQGTSCEPCPKPATATFNDLCPKGPGFVDRKDINECTEFPGMCDNGRCRNTVGGFNCRCNQGYTLDENGIKCADIDECSIMHGVCGNGTCINKPGTFSCDCNKGYESSMMMRICMDINECERIPGLCRGGSCRNTPGSFKCDCPPGLELAPDKRSCKDIDECSRTSGICSNGVCENMMGTYQCVCDDGYQHGAIKSHCEDIDECMERNGGCEGICVNSPGSYACSCRTGFTLMIDGRSCADMDECRDNPRICSGGVCSNTIGSYSCKCTNGLLPGPDSSSCVDINECEADKEVCGNGDCENSVGSYRCHCEEGYSVKPRSGPQCTDDDECALMVDNCDLNADCINNPGSYSCRCRDGFTGDGLNCRDINECLTNNGGCNQNAQCVNTDGSFKCVCDSGFRGDGYSCLDVDECSENPMLCENGQCLNHPGSYRCECEMGFMHPSDNTETSCIDINECLMFNNLCVYGRCENVFGMFKCECNEGYQLDNTGGNCTDINECESPQACQYGTCINTQGSYKCQCPPNHQLVPAGNACVDKRESRCYLSVDERYGRRRCHDETGQPVTKATCCCSLGVAWGPRCEECPPPDSPQHKDLCPGGPGYRPNKVTVVLEDINECEEHDNLCKNGHCTNTFGSFTCSCNDGFRLNSTTATCIDINECNEGPLTCGAGFCVNDEGGYHCICPDGYMLLPNGKECVDMRKERCFLDYSDGECLHPMTNRQTRMVCCCSMGKGWGEPCTPCPGIGSLDHLSLCGTHPGQITNPLTNQTEEIDECNLMPTMCSHGTCLNTPGSFECQCKQGFSYDIDSHQCIDENECIRTPSPCRGNAQCINSPGSFECQCPDGYKMATSMRDCKDIDECFERAEVCSHGTCNNFQGSFQCVCHNGYTLTPSRDSCLDIDECTRHPNICNNGTCTNTDGSYRCLCHPGFKLSHNHDCIDVDECHQMPFLCRNGRCRNTIGSFRCECAQGYSLTPDGQNCRDVNECNEIEGTCPQPGRCQNTVGSFLCTCPPGYRLAVDKKSCIDIDECEEGRNICEGGTCINTVGGVICDCPEGFVLSDSKIKCVDIRQEICFDNYSFGRCTSPRMEIITLKECCCSMGAAWGKSCSACPTEGTDEFSKLCPQGIGRGDAGEDINECTFMPDACTGGDCINTDGSFRCECPQGYVLDSTGKACIDDNECISGNNICGNGTCSNVDGSFDCSCNLGFAPGPMQTCEDINECNEMSNQCAFRCHNVPGSFRCICPYGYTLAPDGRLCQDVDECSTPANNCKFQCKNLIGSFLCVCPEGYTQIGVTDDCIDINECHTTPNICDNGRCVNLQGTYRCDCYPGFKPSYDSKKCIDERQGYCFRKLINGKCKGTMDMKTTVTKAECCCSMGAAWGPGCERCPPISSMNYTELCPDVGFNIDGNDIDECRAMADLCKNGRCINTLGSYRCLCNKGYKADVTGTQCRDVNECEAQPRRCKHACHNTDGSFVCTCPRGYTLGADGSTCLDIDECATGQHTCQYNCVNTEGSYDCSCPKGYTQHHDHCSDIDECVGGMCPPPGNCINTLGSFRCLCPRGMKLDSSGTHCSDLNECAESTAKCQHGCQNVLGGYRCGCPEGYHQHAYSNRCLDEDECTSSPCPGDATCENTFGSFKCNCLDGFRYDTNLSLCMQQVNLQVGSVCYGSPCAFGCIPLSDGGFSCGCPAGYQTIAQGHCLQTINPLTPFNNYPNGREADNIQHGNIISTEGCFSCKTNGNVMNAHLNSNIGNGRQRRMTNNTRTYVRFKGIPVQRNFVKKRMYWRQRVRKSNSSSRLKNVVYRHKRHHHDENLLSSGHKVKLHKVLKLNLAQTKHRLRIVKLQPAIKKSSSYKITKGNEKGIFEIQEKHGIWSLHFQRRLKTPGNFSVEVTGTPDIQDTDLESPFILRIKIIVSS